MAARSERMRRRPLTSEEARQQAEAEGLTLLKADDSKTGYLGVKLDQRSKPKPYQAQVRRGGKKVHLGRFATAEEAALHVARSPEGRAAAERATSALPQQRSEGEGRGNAPATRSRATLKEEATVPAMPAGAFVKEEELPPMPPDAFVKEEVFVKLEHEAVVEEGGRTEGRAKRRRNA